MNQNFTYDDLLRYCYHDTDKAENKAIEAALKTDAKLQMALEQIQETMRTLDGKKIGPSKTSLSIIMDYAGEQHPELQ